jgi:endonuclease-3
MLTIIADKAKFVLEVHHRLYEVYGSKIRYLYNRDPLSELVDTILSQRTKNRDSAKAFTNLVERFGTWEKVRDAPLEDVLQAIKPSTWPEQKHRAYNRYYN